MAETDNSTAAAEDYLAGRRYGRTDLGNGKSACLIDFPAELKDEVPDGVAVGQPATVVEDSAKPGVYSILVAGSDGKQSSFTFRGRFRDASDPADDASGMPVGRAVDPSIEQALQDKGWDEKKKQYAARSAEERARFAEASEDGNTDGEVRQQDAEKTTAEAAQKLQSGSQELQDIHDRLVDSAAMYVPDGESNVMPAEGESKSAVEVVDVLNDFGWTYDRLGNGFSVAGGQYAQRTQVPYLYVTEYRQLYSSSITNLVNQFAAMGNAMPHAADALQRAGKVFDGTIVGSAFKTIGEALGKVREDIDNGASGSDGKDDRSTEQTVSSWLTSSVGEFIGKVAKNVDTMYAESPIGDSTLLSPYKWLYAVRSTGKCFVFPFVNEAASRFSVDNSWDDNPKESSVLNNGLFQMVKNISNLVTSVSTDLTKVVDFVEGYQQANNTEGQVQRGLTETSVETAKFYNFKTQGEEVTVSFPLYNTFRKGLWKRHYQFIFNFALRNMPFRLDNMSYKVPMLYDLTVPGFKRLPICYVSSFTASPQGIIHVLDIDDGFVKQYTNPVSNGNGSLDVGAAPERMAVYVPEVWNVKIKFQSLVSSTANTMLSAVADTPIKVDTSVVGGVDNGMMNNNLA